MKKQVDGADPSYVLSSLQQLNLSKNSQLMRSKFDLIPKNYSISDKYPNPFNDITMITFQLPEKNIVKINIIDIIVRIKIT